jgi:hypothetical protein
MGKDDYVPPVNQLLIYGDARDTLGRWPNYLALGLQAEHIADLIRMTQDDDLHWADGASPEVWAPMHAWRALGQLRAEAAIEPLLGLLHRIDDDQDDWVGEDMPEVFGLIGPAVIPALATYLANPKHRPYARAAAAAAFRHIAQKHPAARAECVAALVRQLEKYADNDRLLNAMLMAPLLELNAVEAAPVMEQAFAAKAVDFSVSGDWEDVQIELGLKGERETPRPNYGFVGASSVGRKRHKRKKK